MTPPQGQRHFTTAAQAHQAAKSSHIESFVVLHDPRRREFAWVGPKEFFLTRMPQALLAGIQIVERA